MTQSWNFAGIEGAGSEIDAAVNKTSSLLDEGGEALRRLQAAWTGSGQQSYEAVQQRWNQGAAELRDSLGKLSQAIRRASSAMQDTEKGVAATFGG